MIEIKQQILRTSEVDTKKRLSHDARWVSVNLDQGFGLGTGVADGIKEVL
jgi:hypothetical protein